MRSPAQQNPERPIAIGSPLTVSEPSELEMAMMLAPFPMAVLDAEGSILKANDRFTVVFPCTPDDLQGSSFLPLVNLQDQCKMKEALGHSGSMDRPTSLSVQMVDKQGQDLLVHWSIRRDPHKNIIFCYGEIIPASLARNFYDAIAILEKRFLQQLTLQPHIPVMEVMDSLLIGIEELYPGSICSILKLSPDHCLLHYSAPHLPKEYTDLINGAKPGPKAGSCGTAVFLDKTIIVSDIATDPLWEDYREIALPFGLHSCWSVPIHYSGGAILGTFGIYHRHRSLPSDDMKSAIERLANLIGLVIENREMIDSLRLATERYDLSTNATHDMIWDWDLQKNEIFRNEKGLRNIYGFTTNDPIKQIEDWVSRIHPADKERVQQEIDNVPHSKGKSTFEAEYRFLSGEEKYVYVHDRGYIIRDAQGDAIRVIGATQDITDRVKGEQLIRDSEERYRRLFQSNPVPMWIFDLETTRFLEVNQMALRQYGYTAEEFSRMTLFDLRSPSEQERLRQTLIQDKVENKTFLRGNWQHQKKNGELIHVDILSHKLQYKGYDAMLVLANDITHNILLQDQLLEEKNIRQIEIMKATIGAQEKERNEIGHELHDNVNQILTSAKLYFECVGRYDDKQEEYRVTGIGLILEAVEEIRRISKSMAPPRLQDVGLIRSIADLLGNLSDTSGMQVDFQHDDFTEDSLDDSLKLTIYRIVQEQITNVVKHAGAARLSISIYREEGLLKVVIQDNGKGHDPAAVRNGIGITNIINRASLHNGIVHIESAPGHGFGLNITF
jgi:PAS domain S-box-containing protein